MMEKISSFNYKSKKKYTSSIANFIESLYILSQLTKLPSAIKEMLKKYGHHGN
tara:strand:+ start:218 stop:376 length:159 start_codon:yes stop_codon:yes gene_type:complete